MSYNQKLEAYFHNKDRELIENRKIEELEKLQAEIEDATAPAHSSCSSCGEGESVTKQLDGIEFKVCDSCYDVTLSHESLDQIYKEQKFAKLKFTVDKYKERNELLKAFEQEKAG